MHAETSTENNSSWFSVQPAADILDRMFTTSSANDAAPLVPMVEKIPAPPPSVSETSCVDADKRVLPGATVRAASSTQTPRRRANTGTRRNSTRDTKYTRNTYVTTEPLFPESEYEQFVEKERKKNKRIKAGFLSGALGAIGGFMVAGPPGALAGMFLVGGAGTTYSGTASPKNYVRTSGEGSDPPHKWKRHYRDPLQIEPPNEKRVKFLLKWARLKIDEGGNEDTIILLFDEVLTHLSPWTARARMPDQAKDAHRMIAHFGKFMDHPKVYQHFRLANRAWLAAWELNKVDMNAAYFRFVHILPCLVQMREIVQPNGHVSPRICGAVPPPARPTMSESFRSLDLVKDWVEDTLDRISVKNFVKEYTARMETMGSSSPDTSPSPNQSELELPPEGAEDEMELGNPLDYDADEFFDAIEDQPMRSVSTLLHDYQRSCQVPNEEHRWDESNSTWQVRSDSYMRDRVKLSSAPSVTKLLAMDIAHSGGQDIVQMTLKKDSAYQYLRDSGNTGYLLVVNWRLPPMHVVCVFGMEGDGDPLFQEFLTMSHAERNQRLKVIPFCGEGPWLARTAIGSKPALIGKKLDVTYFDGPDFLEISINVFSSAAAKSMMNIVCGVAKKMVIDVAMLIEATREEELPERVLGAFRVIRPDTSRMRQLHV